MPVRRGEAIVAVMSRFSAREVRDTTIALMASVVVLVFVVPVFAGDCKPEYTAQGDMAGPAQSDAERVARVYWRNQVSRKYGPRYSDWNKAGDARMECIKLNADTYRCWATATPCSDGS